MSFTINRNYQFWEKTLQFLGTYATEIIVWLRKNPEDIKVDSVVLMFINVSKRIMVHIYFDLSFFDSTQITTAFQVLRQISNLHENNVSLVNIDYKAPYIKFEWSPHTEENTILVEELSSLFPTLPPVIVDALSKITDKVYYKKGPKIPLVICKQFPNQDAALKVFVGGL